MTIDITIASTDLASTTLTSLSIVAGSFRRAGASYA